MAGLVHVQSIGMLSPSVGFALFAGGIDRSGHEWKTDPRHCSGGKIMNCAVFLVSPGVWGEVA